MPAKTYGEVSYTLSRSTTQYFFSSFSFANILIFYVDMVEAEEQKIEAREKSVRDHEAKEKANGKAHRQAKGTENKN